MVEEKMDRDNVEQGPMEEHPFYRNRSLKALILILTIAVLVIPVVMIINTLLGKPAFFFF
ncbi:MAG: hypothetical protein PHS52_07565 [Desulfotomaculaceae bacterium]|nr:hypothetical protein [Desulfotomaculaceae bacterium]